MAAPIEFHVRKVDPKLELEQRLAAAPREHAEALLAALNMLEAAHDEGLLELATGAMRSKNEVAAEIAKYARQPESTNATRNLIALGKLVGSLSPEKMDAVLAPPAPKQEAPPTLWQLFQRMRGTEVRRGLGIALGLLAVLGSAHVKQERSSR